MPFIACLTNTQQKTQTTKTNTPHSHPPPKNRGPTTQDVENATDPGVGLPQDARVHYSQIKNHTHQHPHHDEHHHGQTKEAQNNQPHPTNRGTGPDSSGPNSVPTPHPRKPPPRFHTHTPGSSQAPTGTRAETRAGSTEDDRLPTGRGPTSTIPLVNTTIAHPHSGQVGARAP